MENGQVVLVSRIGGEKQFVVDRSVWNEEVTALLDEIQQKMFERRSSSGRAISSSVDTLDELKDTRSKKNAASYLAGWCGSEACEHQVKEETGATSRNIPSEVKEHKRRCLVCREAAKHTVVFARAY